MEFQEDVQAPSRVFLPRRNPVFQPGLPPPRVGYHGPTCLSAGEGPAVRLHAGLVMLVSVYRARPRSKAGGSQGKRNRPSAGSGRGTDMLFSAARITAPLKLWEALRSFVRVPGLPRRIPRLLGPFNAPHQSACSSGPDTRRRANPSPRLRSRSPPPRRACNGLRETT